MNIWEGLTLTVVFSGILGLFLITLTQINKRTLREESKLTRQIIKETHEETLKVLKLLLTLLFLRERRQGRR